MDLLVHVLLLLLGRARAGLGLGRLLLVDALGPVLVELAVLLADLLLARAGLAAASSAVVSFTKSQPYWYIPRFLVEGKEEGRKFKLTSTRH